MIAACPFVTHHFSCSQDWTQTSAQAHRIQMLPLVALAWETFQESYSVTLCAASGKRSNQTKVLVVRN